MLKLKAATTRRKISPRRRQVVLLNTIIDDLTLEDLLDCLGHGGVVFTTNVDHLMKLQVDQEFCQVYASADYRVCDSQILKYASYFLGTPIREKISGSDLFPAFCRHYAQDSSIRLFLLGAAPGVAAEAGRRINQRAGRDFVVDTYSPPFGFEKDTIECERIVRLINQSGATVLAVGLGAPKQEKWIQHYREQLPVVRAFIAVGATLDFEAGNLSRAPRWVSEAGFEWLYRLLCEPQRLWRRYLGDALPFLWLMVQQKRGCYRQTDSAETDMS